MVAYTTRMPAGIAGVTNRQQASKVQREVMSSTAPATVFGVIRFATVRIIGPRATIAIGVKSFTGSNGRLVWMAAFVVNELDCRTSV